MAGMSGTWPGTNEEMGALVEAQAKYCECNPTANYKCGACRLVSEPLGGAPPQRVINGLLNGRHQRERLEIEEHDQTYVDRLRPAA